MLSPSKCNFCLVFIVIGYAGHQHDRWPTTDQIWRVSCSRVSSKRCFFLHILSCRSTPRSVRSEHDDLRRNSSRVSLWEHTLGVQSNRSVYQLNKAVRNSSRGEKTRCSLSRKIKTSFISSYLTDITFWKDKSRREPLVYWWWNAFWWSNVISQPCSGTIILLCIAPLTLSRSF